MEVAYGVPPQKKEAKVQRDIIEDLEDEYWDPFVNLEIY